MEKKTVEQQWSAEIEKCSDELVEIIRKAFDAGKKMPRKLNIKDYDYVCAYSIDMDDWLHLEVDEDDCFVVATQDGCGQMVRNLFIEELIKMAEHMYKDSDDEQSKTIIAKAKQSQYEVSRMAIGAIKWSASKGRQIPLEVGGWGECYDRLSGISTQVSDTAFRIAHRGRNRAWLEYTYSYTYGEPFEPEGKDSLYNLFVDELLWISANMK